jgi:hypothetical protein
MQTGAEFSKDRKYRYKLWRKWDESLPKIMFIGLNPSTADEIKDDPTITRMMNYAKLWGYGEIVVCNAFAFRATFPEDLKKEKDPVGEGNNKAISEEAKNAEKIVLAWGNHALFGNRSSEILQLLKEYKLFCLGKNSSGEPKHPLYLKRDLKPVKLE